MLQARLSADDPRLYSPQRDVAHCFGAVMEEALRRASYERWADLAATMRPSGVDEADVGEALACLAAYVAGEPRSGDNLAVRLEEAGFMELAPAARVAALASLGLVMVGVFHNGVREATVGGVGPAATYAELVAGGRDCADWLKRPRWLRRLAGLVAWRRLRRAFEALRRPA